tara:strand:+ start:524 stop:796 length:273 start_codon:yes stop_codon:yes gene_type:complete
MADQKLMDDKEVEFYKLQRELSDDLDKAIDKVTKTFSDDSNLIVAILFLFMWSKFHHIYGVKGEKADTYYARSFINKIIDGDIPPKSFTN